jgi:nucleoid DNA-binding protein
MNRTDLSKALARQSCISRESAARLVDRTFDIIKDALVSGESVKVPDFGTFKVVERSARTGRNPNTGEAVQVPARKAIVFVPYARLKDAIQEE